ncbi:MAG: transglycosylase SLT domain-containing protein [Gemmatimonadaceae bacterium]|nr:transglycosylase SLT domain-containing protein [Gemmatimonadaceae bacterium]NUR36417.1 transglycosylase SLT domain-containing protein [Gemmatimonadaceae bacterium]NUS32789.1 transglycosylase SLT domain-containing protein [Gemmatimonadaceae bacterium]NUS47490.1 transglycosylase SLT domain-containing protein [Gemmatimonadaceae bacterium]
MKNLRGTYVHRGDAHRRRTRIRQTVLVVSFFSASAFLLGNRKPVSQDAIAAPVPSHPSTGAFRINLSTDRSLAAQLDSTRGELDLAHMQLERANKIIGYSTQYRIRADLATTILDIASAEGIDPELAFRLVKLESDFNPRATSPVGAIGLTQVMPATARYYVKGITAEGLYDPATNLRVGFRYLRGLVKEYHNDMNLALLVYNRGPVAVEKARAEGDNPSNGYDRILTRGYRGKGTVN